MEMSHLIESDSLDCNSRLYVAVPKTLRTGSFDINA